MLKLKSLFIVIISCSFCHADTQVRDRDVDLVISRMKAARFLNQATMGPTTGEIYNLGSAILRDGEDAALNAWIDSQFNKRVVKQIDRIRLLSDGNHDRGQFYQDHTWWDQAVRSDDQLRQRVTWGLSQIIVASSLGQTSSQSFGAPYYWDILQKHAFGNYREMLSEVTYCPLMGSWLTYVKNAKGDEELGIFADENYARELMQLFSMGIYQRNSNGSFLSDSNGNLLENYTNDDIESLAKIMTGLNYAGGDNGEVSRSFFTSGSNWLNPMVMNEEYHDKTEKRLLGVRFPAGGDGDAEIERALDIIAGRSVTSVHMSNELIKRLTTSNPSRNYLATVIRTWRETNGDLGSVVREILMHPDVRDNVRYEVESLGNGQSLIKTIPLDNLDGKIKEPALMMTQFLRYFEVNTSQNGGILTLDTSVFSPGKQRPLHQTTVFNDFSTEYLPPAGPVTDIANRFNLRLVLPELEILQRNYIELYSAFSFMGRTRTVGQNLDRNAPPADLGLMQDWSSVNRDSRYIVQSVNRNMCAGLMPMDLQDEIVEILDQDTNNERRIHTLITILVNSPSYIVSY